MKISKSSTPNSITMTTKNKSLENHVSKWWLASNQDDLCGQLLGTAAYLKETQQYRYRQAAIYARLYGNVSLYNFIGSNINKIDSSTGLPSDRPTFNLIQSCVDTLISRISQSRPSPVFLTDNSDYRERRLAKQLNNFILGELYQTKAYDKAAVALRDALVEGTGILKIYQTVDNKVGIDRILLTELLVDQNEAKDGDPRQLYQLKLVDRDVLIGQVGNKKIIEKAVQAYPDNSADSAKSVSDLVMVIEGWRLPSYPGADDGRHTIACSSGIILDEKWKKDKFPFVFLHYSQRLAGFWSQGLAEQVMGTQLEINSLLYTISKAIKIMGVPRVFQEDGSKIMSSSHNNDIGVIVKFRGTKPLYEVAPCNAPELYTQLQRLIDYGYQQTGVSAMQASGKKPAGLDSGEAQRVYDDIATDRFAALSRKWDNIFIDLAYLIIDTAKDIATETGSYTTIYPNKNGIKEINLPEISILDNPYVIQCFNMSSLPRDPAGRMQKITEMIQSGMITVKEGRRLLDYPDLEQVEKLANSSEERILQILDEIVEDGKYTPPDPFMDLTLAMELVTQYYNLYSSAKLEEGRADMLRNFFNQIKTLQLAAMPPQPPAMPPGGAAGPVPQANPQPLPTSPLVPNANS